MTQSKAKEPESEEVVSLKAKLVEAECQKAKVVEELTRTKGILKNLKSIGRNFREKSEKAVTEVENLKKEITALTETCCQVTADLNTKTEELKKAKDLVERFEPESVQKLIEMNEELKKMNEDLDKKCAEKEERAKKVLETAKEKLNNLQAKIQEQRKIICSSKDKTLIDEKNKMIEEAKREKELMKSALESQMTKIKAENLALNSRLLEVQGEKLKQQELLSQLQLRDQQTIGTMSSEKDLIEQKNQEIAQANLEKEHIMRALSLQITKLQNSEQQIINRHSNEIALFVERNQDLESRNQEYEAKNHENAMSKMLERQKELTNLDQSQNSALVPEVSDGALPQEPKARGQLQSQSQADIQAQTHTPRQAKTFL